MVFGQFDRVVSIEGNQFRDGVEYLLNTRQHNTPVTWIGAETSPRPIPPTDAPPDKGPLFILTCRETLTVRQLSYIATSAREVIFSSELASLFVCLFVSKITQNYSTDFHKIRTKR